MLNFHSKCLFLPLQTYSAVYPIYNFIKNKNAATAKAALGSTTNATNGALPSMPGRFTLIDPDTPDSAKTKTSYATGESWTLVFSDEFEKEGRTFYPGAGFSINHRSS